MNCSHVKKHLIAYLEKSLSQAELDLFNVHVATCSSCQKLIAKCSAVYTSFDVVKPELTPFFSTRVIARLKGGEELYNPWIPVSVINLLKPLAAGLLLLTATTFGIFYAQDSFSVFSENTPTVATTWANDYYLNTSEDTMVDLIINNEK